jgi:LysR family hca operon transcriptional activator
MAGVDLRHLRYFIAVAEEGSLTTAAERRLHVAQPSLSRQIRALELEIGVPLLERRPRGVELTPAGRAFLDQARLTLLQAEAAGEAARRAARPGRASFILGFLTGHELDWLPAALGLLRAEAPETPVTIVSDASPALAGGLLRGAVDAAIMRREASTPGLAFRPLRQEPLAVVLPADHALAAHPALSLTDLTGQAFISPTKAAPALKRVIEDYFARAGVRLVEAFEAENLAMAMALVGSTGGVTLLPSYARRLLPPDLTWRPLVGEAPSIELVVGCARANASAAVQRFVGELSDLARREQLAARGLAAEEPAA